MEPVDIFHLHNAITSRRRDTERLAGARRGRASVPEAVLVQFACWPAIRPERTKRPDLTDETVSNLGVCRTAKRTAGAALCDGVIVLGGTVHHRASNLEHQMRAAWRPPHLLLGVHPAMHQPLHCAFGDRRGNRLLAPPGRRIIDDDIALPEVDPGNWTDS
jgi:hypothetical protein